VIKIPVILPLDTGVFSSNMQEAIWIALRLEAVPDHTPLTCYLL
jgi:hypothetical protein